MFMNLVAFIWPHHTLIRIAGVGLPFEDKYVRDRSGWNEGADYGNVFSICYPINLLWNRNLQTSAAGKY